MKVLTEYDNSYKSKVSCIYKVTNTLNGMILIGKTSDFRKRVSDYRNADKFPSSRPISRAIKADGEENFTIEILELCPTDKLSERERYYIQLSNSTDPKIGYNVLFGVGKEDNSEETRRRKSESHKGLKESAETKKKKSNRIIAIKDNNFIISDSGKLFGDYVGKGKDQIKNGLRQPSTICGYHLYYDDYNKRQEIRFKMLTKRCIRDKEYMKILDILDAGFTEGVETIYSYFPNTYALQYAESGEHELELKKITLGKTQSAG